jgi:DTW domain-containing protein YfiP
MKRAICLQCHRAKLACICHLVEAIDNKIDVIVLQHPSEVKQSKGSVTLLSNSLVKCQVIVGETFDENEMLASLIRSDETKVSSSISSEPSQSNHWKSKVALLYPSEEAITLDTQLLEKHINHADNPSHENRINKIPQYLIILDGTWKKAYKMYMKNSWLHEIPHFTLSDDIIGQYQIRKTQKKNALSSLEACSYALSFLEQLDSKDKSIVVENTVSEKYQKLINNFVQFNEFQLSFHHKN